MPRVFVPLQDPQLERRSRSLKGRATEQSLNAVAYVPPNLPTSLSKQPCCAAIGILVRVTVAHSNTLC